MIKAMGPLQRLAALNMARYRKQFRWSYVLLSQHLARNGRPIPVLGLRRMERGERAITVDDLYAIARVLEVTPEMLLSPLDQEGEGA